MDISVEGKNEINDTSDKIEEVFLLDSDIEDEIFEISDSKTESVDDISNKTSADESTSSKDPDHTIISPPKAIEQDDIICQLISRPFSVRHLSEQILIIKNGRPTPILNPESSNVGRLFKTAAFTKSIYSVKWMTASRARDKLYCWTCLLFPVTNTIWNQEGFSHLRTLKKMAISHSKSKHHISSCVKLNRFKNQFLPQETSNRSYDPDLQLIERREVFKRLLDGWWLYNVRLSKNREDRLELYDCLFKHNGELLMYWYKLRKDPIRIDNVMKGLSVSVKNIILKQISSEIHKSKFFSVIIDDQPDGHISIVVRFVNQTDAIGERLLGLFRVKDKTAQGLFGTINSVLRPFLFRTKMVAHCFSGGSLSVDQIVPFVDRIKAINPHSIFVNCSYHSLCETIAAGSHVIPDTRVFFSALKSFPRFIVETLEKTSYKNFNARIRKDSDVKETVSFILINRNDLIKFFADLEGFDHETMNSSYFYLALLKEVRFICLLISFNLIFVCFNNLDLSENRLQQQANCEVVTDFASLQKWFESVEIRLNTMRSDDGLSTFFDSLAQLEIQPDESLIQLFKDLVANTVDHLDARFKSLQVLKIFELVDSRRFSSYSLTFPSDAFAAARKCLEKMASFDFYRLRNELEVIYSDPGFRLGSPADIMKAIGNSNLQDVLRQFTNLLILVRTIPPTYGTFESASVYSSVIQRRIGEFTRTQLPREFDIIYAHSDLLTELKKSVNWYDDVMKCFDNSEYKSSLKVF